jgi:hypothetical protein
VIKEFSSVEDAKKVEETVKTGYVETSIESLVHWAAVEDDLAESYGLMAESSRESTSHDAFLLLQQESKRNTVELSGLVDYLEGLDKARIKRIEMLEGLKR